MPREPKLKSEGLVLHDVGDYERYKKVQVVANKLKHGNVFAKKENIRYLAQRFKPYNVLCHGVRNGAEIDYFISGHVGYAPYTIGTDIAPSDHPFVTQHDMHEPIPLNKFELVYSNSWDHSYDPEKMFNVWAEQVSPNGHMVLEHTSLHCPSHANERDPFGATREQLVALLKRVLGAGWKVWVLDDAPNQHHDLCYIVARRV